ncbi:MAG: molybdopterin molybdotransferase MoeA, partial [Bacteroidota bacterium]|nr:molybdopterin molybdotransferase MoeA [Bacteroidota bacterium]
ALISVAASIGKSRLLVKKLPKAVVISSGDELVPVDETPSPFQIRRSNGYTIAAALKTFKIEADILHIPDDPDITRQKIGECLQNYDVIILTGGISMGKFDYIPKALEELSVHKLFHKVQQRPGKPFWFGVAENGVVVFALPGNPVSTFMCFYRYIMPWLQTSLGVDFTNGQYAILNKDFSFKSPLQYFLQVKLKLSCEGQLLAEPLEGNGSGDFANLPDTDAFMELPLERNNFTKGEVYQIWRFSGMFI